MCSPGESTLAVSENAFPGAVGKGSYAIKIISSSSVSTKWLFSVKICILSEFNSCTLVNISKNIFT